MYNLIPTHKTELIVIEKRTSIGNILVDRKNNTLNNNLIVFHVQGVKQSVFREQGSRSY